MKGLLEHHEDSLDPLLPTIKKMNCIQAAAEAGKVQVTRSLINFLRRRFKAAKKEKSRFAWLKCCKGKQKTGAKKAQVDYESRQLANALNLATEAEGLTPLHITAMRSAIDKTRLGNYYELIKILLRYGSDPELYDVRNWTALNYCNHRELKKLLDLAKEKKIRDRRNDKSNNEMDEIRLHNFKYQFCIISKATDIDPANNIVFKELSNIRENNKLIGDIDIKCFYEVFNSRSQFIFAVRFDQKVIDYYVDNLDFTIYNILRKYHCTFIASKSEDYEPIKDYYARNIILMVITMEFNLSNFMAEGLIVDYFNLHEFMELDNIRRNWKTKWYKILSNPITLHPSTEAVIFLSGVAHYYGCHIGLLFGFLCHLINSLMLPSMFSIAMLVLKPILQTSSKIILL